MFDLNQAVHQYCRHVPTRRFRRTAQSRELEDHLHCEIEQLIGGGMLPEAAFLKATMNLGSAQLLQNEFRKNAPRELGTFFEFKRCCSFWRYRATASRFKCRMAVAAILVLAAVPIFRLWPNLATIEWTQNLVETGLATAYEFLNLPDSGN